MNNKYVIGGIVIALLIFIGWREYSHYEERRATKESYESVIAFHEGEKAQLKNSLDLKVVDEIVMRQNIMTSDIANEHLKGEIEGFKEINSYMKSEVLAVIRKLEVQYKESNRDNPFEGLTLKNDEYVHKDDVEKNFLRLPKTFEHKEDSGWFYLSGVVKKESVSIDSLSMLNKFDATIGFKKPDKRFGWMKKKEPVVSLKSYNPYSEIVYVNNVTVKDKKNKAGNILLSKPAFFLYGVVAGRAF